LLGLAAIGAEATAQDMGLWMQHQERDRGDRVQRRILSVREAIASAERQVPGRYIGMRADGTREERPYYILAWALPDGRVVDIRVDAVTGRVSR
jgi:uncharacterized membrane protein YkoI